MAEHDTPARTGAPVRQMIGFRLGTEKFAIDIGRIHEIVKPHPVTMVPDIPPGYSGMIHLRERVVLMADLHRRFGLPPYLEGKDGRIIVLEREDQPVGILVDAVSEVVRLQPHMIEASPRFYNGITVDFIEAVGKQNGELLTILDTEVLFAEPPTVELPPIHELTGSMAEDADHAPDPPEMDMMADPQDVPDPSETETLHADPSDGEPDGPETLTESDTESEIPAEPEALAEPEILVGAGIFDESAMLAEPEDLDESEVLAEPEAPVPPDESEFLAERAAPDESPESSDTHLPDDSEPALSVESTNQEEDMKNLDKAAMHDELYQDIGHLARYINRAHQSFNQEMEEDEDPIRTKAKDLPTANDILQQVTLDTEAATMRIISGVEETNTTLSTLKGMMEELEEALPASAKHRDKVCDIVGRIREEMGAIESLQDQTLITLSFQDLTGQKIRQVIRLMMEVEERILGLVVKYGINLAEDAEQAVEEKIDSLRAKPDPTLRQDKVDDLLGEFGF